MSDPSLPSEQVCKTDQDIPEKNPENVIGEGDEPDNLVIYWTVIDFFEKTYFFRPNFNTQTV